MFNFGLQETLKKSLADLQFSTARGSNDDVARPKRVTSFNLNQQNPNESGLNTERVRNENTIRSNPGQNKKSNGSSSNNVKTGSFNSKKQRMQYDPISGMFGQADPMKLMYGPGMKKKKSSEHKSNESTKKSDKPTT